MIGKSHVGPHQKDQFETKSPHNGASSAKVQLTVEHTETSNDMPKRRCYFYVWLYFNFFITYIHFIY